MAVDDSLSWAVRSLFFVKPLFTNSSVVSERDHHVEQTNQNKKTARRNLTENYNFYTLLTQALINMFC